LILSASVYAVLQAVHLKGQTMFNDLRGHVALVSGAGSEGGIGFAIARRLGDLGAKLIITGSSARIHDRVADLSAAGYEVEGRAADLTDQSQVVELVA
jgi:3-oxoacyl-[acyl-carrier protein] reductase